jgi:protein translocase SecG subunit
MGILTGFLVVLFIIICVLLVLCILLQKGRGGGLSAAFGGAGSAFGTKTGDMFTWVTIVLTAIFLVLVLVLVWCYRGEIYPVATPMFSPVPTGQETEAVDVTISVDSSKAEVFYSIDNADFAPYVAGTLITVEPGQTLRAYADEPGFHRSETAVATYGKIADEPIAPAESELTEPAEAAPADTPTGDDAPVEEPVPADAGN